MKGYNSDGVELTYDSFIRNDPSLSRSYPTWLTVKDSTIIAVRTPCTCTMHQAV